MTHLSQEVAMTIKIEGEAFASWDGLDDQVVRRIADHFISDRTMALGARVSELIGAKVNDLVSERVEAFLSRPVVARDAFGDPVSGAQPKTIADIVKEAADAAMTETVDPATGAPKKISEWGASRVIPRGEYLIKKLAISEIAKAVEAAVKTVNADAKTAVQRQVAAEIAARLAAAK